MAEPEFEIPVPAGLWRRLAAMIYDLLLLFAWVFIPWVAAFMILERTFGGPLFQGLVYLQIGLFFTYFWRLKGQTLGMQVWKIRTENDRGEVLSWSECIVRYFFATFSLALMGLGFLWIIFDPDKLAWHDRASGTRVLYLGKDPYQMDSKKKQTAEKKTAKSREESV